MGSGKSPFEILGISPDAEPEVINAAFRALARKYHPDKNPGVPPSELNRKMVDLNWAKEELERDLDGWRKRASPQQKETMGARGGTINVEPQVIILPGRRGAAATFWASCAGLASSIIRARFKEGLISVERLSPRGEEAVFNVIVKEDFPSDFWDNATEMVEVVAPGFTSNKVFVSLAPLTPSILSQQYRGKVAPPRHASDSARISFGKHAGRTFREIAVEEPSYLDWMLREGAGSQVERASAQLALDFVRIGRKLTPAMGRAGTRLRSEKQRSPSVALPDPSRPGGLWDTIKRLFGPKRLS